MELIEFILKWLGVPLAGFGWHIYSKQQEHHTSLEVLKTQIRADKDSHERENSEMRESLRAIFGKLDSIETALRK